MSPVESTARQCTIHVIEIWDIRGERILGTRARADYDDHELCAVESDEPADTPAKLGALLGQLGVLIGEIARRAA